MCSSCWPWFLEHSYESFRKKLPRQYLPVPEFVEFFISSFPSVYRWSWSAKPDSKSLQGEDVHVIRSIEWAVIRHTYTYIHTALDTFFSWCGGLGGKESIFLLQQGSMLVVVSGQHFYLSPLAVKHRPIGSSETRITSIFYVNIN